MLAFFVFVACVIAAIIYFAYQWQRKRREALEAVAEALGLSFSPANDRELARAHRRFEAMSQGSSPRAYNVFRGAHRGRDVVCFDFDYTISNGKSSTTHTHAVVMTPVPATWPRLRIVPEHIGHKLAGAVGFEDINFESDEFSRRFWVRSPERRFAYDLLHARAMEFLLEPGLRRWEVRDGWLCAWETRAFKPPQIAPALDRVTGFLDLVPTYVWNDASPKAGSTA